ncbi:MAG: right-handed parallel beta-helix repeat-containing protein [Candidatus Thorarchaeota archaeon]
MKTKRIAFILILAIFVMTASVSNSPNLSSDYQDGAVHLMITGQLNDPIEITNNVELAERSSSGVGTRSDPYILEDLTINSTHCLQIRNTNAFFTIRDSTFTYYPTTRGGIYVVDFVNVEHGTIENCYIRGGDVGISFRNAIDCTIRSCITFDAHDGILLDNSDSCIIIDCKSFSNIIGVMLASSDNCGVINNSFYSNTNRGLQLEAFSENNTIAGNEIGWNVNVNLLDNGINTAFDDGVTFGNAWSDYNSSEDYAIQGTGGSTDIFASLLTDEVRPAVTEVLDKVVDIESIDETITWTASDNFHHQYLIAIDGALVYHESWDGGPITFSVGDLRVGTYFIELTVIDGAGNVQTDEVTLSVISFILGGIGTELVMLASGITVVCFVAIILIAKKIP